LAASATRIVATVLLMACLCFGCGEDHRTNPVTKWSVEWVGTLHEFCQIEWPDTGCHIWATVTDTLVSGLFGVGCGGGTVVIQSGSLRDDTLKIRMQYPYDGHLDLVGAVDDSVVHGTWSASEGDQATGSGAWEARRTVR